MRNFARMFYLTIASLSLGCIFVSCDDSDDEVQFSSNPAAYVKTAAQEKSVRSIWDIKDGKMYHMDYQSDYMLDALLDQGCNSSADLIKFLYVNLLNTKPTTKSAFDYGCSAFVAKTPQGDVICGRNFDYRFASAANILLDNRPVDGKGVRSLGIASMPFLDDKAYIAGSLSDKKTDISAALAAIYCTMDGMNENGLFIGVLSLNGGGAVQHDPAKKDMVTTGLIRAVLDRAASVDEALNLFRSFNFFVDGEVTPKSNHFLIADKTGRSVVLEYMLKDDPKNWVMNVIEGQDYVANVYLSPDQAEGVGQWRFDLLKERLDEKKRVMTEDDAMQLLKDVHQDLNPEEVTSNTQWSVVYNLTKGTAILCVDKDYTHSFKFSFKDKQK